MGQLKNKQIEDEERRQRYAAKCVYCTSPVDSAGETVCGRCQHNLAKDD